MSSKNWRDPEIQKLRTAIKTIDTLRTHLVDHEFSRDWSINIRELDIIRRDLSARFGSMVLDRENEIEFDAAKSMERT